MSLETMRAEAAARDATLSKTATIQKRLSSARYSAHTAFETTDGDEYQRGQNIIAGLTSIINKYKAADKNGEQCPAWFEKLAKQNLQIAGDAVKARRRLDSQPWFNVWL